MKLEGTRFGTIEFAEEDLVTLPDGMIGFSEFNQFVIVNTKDESPFRWLQSLEEPKLAFLLAFPERIIGVYSPEIPIKDASELNLLDTAPYLVFVTATIPKGRPMEATANLSAPVVINADSRIGKQIVLEDEAYTVRYPIFEQRAMATAA